MLLDFYFSCLGFISIFLIVGLISRNKEMLLRIMTIVVLLHILVLAMWSKQIGFPLLMIFIYFFSVDEVSRPYHIKRLPFIIFSILVVLVYYNFHSLVVITRFMFLVVALSVFILKPTIIKQKWYIYLFVFSIIAMGALSLYHMRELALSAVISYILLLQFNDASGYLIGKLYGNTKIFPKISPNKSLEGYMGGLVGTMLALTLLNTAIPILIHEPLWKDLTLALFIMTVGNFGDLLLSMLKRKLEIKDFSSLLPGHGGVLDRFDNILFAAPLFLWLWSWLFPL